MRKTFLSLMAIFCTAALVACGGKTNATNEAATEANDELTLNWATMNVRLDNPGDGPNVWANRRDSMANFIKAQDLDIVGMQEVLYNQLTDLAERLPEYTHVGVGREDGDKKGEAMCIFFKTDKFDVLDTNTFWLSEYPDSIGFIGWDGACPRTATWAKLQDKKTGKIFMAVNTHFDHVGVQARHNGALLIMDKIKEIVGDQPAVLTGDFNITDDDPAYQTLTGSEFVFKDSHKIADVVEGQAYSFHDWNRYALEDRHKIDFIFVTPTIKVNRSYIPVQAEGPEGPFMSDHNPVLVNITF